MSELSITRECSLFRKDKQWRFGRDVSKKG